MTEAPAYQVRARWVEKGSHGRLSRVWEVTIARVPTYTLTNLRRDAAESQIRGELAAILNCPLTSIFLESVER